MRKRGVIALVVVAVLAIGGAVAWRVLRVSQLVDIGVGYSAQLTCACLFISQRPLASCQMDLDPLARRLIRVDVGDGEVRARSLGLARATARFDKQFGCTVLP
jgi:hypothetical protein